MQAPKNGFFYVIDRHDGRLISARNFAPVNWATGIDLQTGRPIETPNARYGEGMFLANPGGAGAHSWHPMAFSPATGLVYIPVQELPMAYRDDPAFVASTHKANPGIDFGLLGVPDDPEQRKAIAKMLKGRLVAWDPVAQKEAWHVEHSAPWNGGVLATAGNLVFEGTADRRFQAFRADDGASLWSFDAQTAVIAGPVSYRAGGEQYIATMAGNGGAVPLALPALSKASRAPNGRVLAFKLNGKAQLPQYTPIPLPPAAPSSETWSKATVAAGDSLYANYCGRCHGASLLSSGITPDLRRSLMVSDRRAFDSVVLEGVLTARGMVSFAGHLTAAQVESIRAYISTGARTLQLQESVESAQSPSE
jgi:mono/diheme cytochrome c family protein